jgi:hypothetical protein
MRTTLSLDDDLGIELQRIQRRSGKPWKQVVNETIRAGLSHVGEQRRAAPAATTQPVRLGRPRVGDISNVHEVLSLVEGDGRV